MKMDVIVNGRTEQRDVVDVNKCERGGPPLLIPFTRKDERAVHTMDGTVYIIDIGAGYNMRRDAKYSDIGFNKPWNRLP